MLVPEHSQRVFKGKIFDVYQWEQELYDGTKTTFEMLKRPDSVHTIAIKDEKIIVLEQEQPGIGSFYSFPGGRSDVEGETELDAAQREMYEETGMRFKTWKLLLATQNHPKIDWIVYLFLATDCIDEGDPHPDAGEKINVTLRTLDEVKELINDPRARHMAGELLRGVSSIQELKDLPACSA